ncbi:uncharacterized protein C8Q71DRAFT_722992 [Rhodofomes roseus]|uniref:Cytochrome c domain-containing protein n=1 Tax=Rhodofomes roseus TaxID=34475 RepID=A0ABQ8KI81_9APHY|nr:uncharacterized protein C8Q71DRAFT_722992 [Rhodofomes roseus]KAH9837664.1 hypothetical protein C8Q71DRAFT_722992 [Rhodofomes roseus]
MIAGLGLPPSYATSKGNDLLRNNEQPRSVSDPRKRRRTEDETEDGGEATRPQPTMVVQNAPDQHFARTITSDSDDDLSLTPGYNSDREPTVGEMDAYHGLDPQTINPIHRPPPFLHPSANEKVAYDNTPAHPTVKEDVFWGPYPQAPPTSQRQARHPPPLSTASFEDPEMDDFIRSMNMPSLDGFALAQPPTHPSQMTAPDTATLGAAPLRQANNGSRPQGPPVIRTYSRPRVPQPPPSQSRTAPRTMDPRSTGHDAPLGYYQPSVPRPEPMHDNRGPVARHPYTTPPRRPVSRCQATPGPPDREQRPMSRASVLSYVAIREEHQPRRGHTGGGDDMLVDEEPRAGQGNPSAPPFQGVPQGFDAFVNLQQNAPYPENQFFVHEDTGINGEGPLAPVAEDDHENHDWTPATVTPAPDGDWRAIQGESFYYKQNGQCPAQHSRWLSSRRQGILASFAGHGARDNDTDSWGRITRLEDMLRNDYGVPQPEISLPDIAPGAVTGFNEDPIYILIQGINAAQQTALLAKKWYVRTDLAVHFSNLSLAPSTWMGAFEKRTAFGTMKAEQILPFFRAAFKRDPLLHITNDTIEQDKKTGPRSKWGATPTSVALEHIVSSITIRIMPRQTTGGVDNPLIQLYCESATNHPRDWVIWRDAVRNQPYSTENGAKAALILAKFKCLLCHSADHPVGLCDLPSVPGWNGPTAEQCANRKQSESHPDNDARGYRGRGGHRGGRGGGRGRGSGRPPNVTTDGASSSRTYNAPNTALPREAGEGWRH